MTILDAYAVIAYLRDEPAADDVAALLTAGGCDLTAVGLAEVTDRMIRLAGADEHVLALDLAELGLGRPIPVTAAIAGPPRRLRRGRNRSRPRPGAGHLQPPPARSVPSGGNRRRRPARPGRLVLDAVRMRRIQD